MITQRPRSGLCVILIVSLLLQSFQAHSFSVLPDSGESLLTLPDWAIDMRARHLRSYFRTTSPPKKPLSKTEEERLSRELRQEKDRLKQDFEVLVRQYKSYEFTAED